MKNYSIKNWRSSLTLQVQNSTMMMVKENLIKNMRRLCVVLVAVLAFSNTTNASHIMGADISYKIIDTLTGEYEITLSLYRDCAGIQYNGANLFHQVGATSGNKAMTLLRKEEVTPICLPPDVVVKPTTNCPRGQIGVNGIKGVERNIFTTKVTLGRNKGYAIVAWSSCCRNNIINTIQNPGGQSCWIQAFINTNYVNNSVIFTTPPIPYWCRQRLNTYNHGAVDTFDPRYITINNKKLIRDSLNYVLYVPFTGVAATMQDAFDLKNPGVTFNPGLNKLNFLYTTNGVTFNNKSGDISCIPSIAQDAIMALAVEEYRAVDNGNGGYSRVKVGYVCRDIQFTVRDICDPIVTEGVIKDSLENSNYIDAVTVDVCGSTNTKIGFKIVGAPGQSLKGRVHEVPNAASVHNFKYKQKIEKKNGTDTLFGTITFDSTVGIGTEYLKLEAFYCTSIGTKVSKYYTLTINFRPAVRVDKQVLYYCKGGRPVRSRVKGGANYSWNPTWGIVNASGLDSSWVDVAPDSNVTYKATAISGIDSTKACTKVDSVKIIVIPPFNYTLSPKVIDLCLHEEQQISLSTQESDTPYRFLWSGALASGLYDTATSNRSTAKSSPVLKVSKSGDLYVEIESKYGCILDDTIKVNMNGVRPIVDAFSARSLICPGDTTLLDLRILPKECGLTVFKSNGVSNEVTYKGVGVHQFPEASGCNSTNPDNCYPSPYSFVGLGKSSIVRYVYTRGELLSAGLKPGTIRSLSFNITTVNDIFIDKYTISMACVPTSSALNPVKTEVVFDEKAITCVGGWKEHVFDRGFDWNGLDNILVELRIEHSSLSAGANRVLTVNSQAFSKAAYKYSNTNGQSVDDVTTGFFQASQKKARPQVRFKYTGIDSSDTQYLSTSWEPAHLVTMLGNPRGIAKASQMDSLFIATVGSTQCNTKDTVKIAIDTNFKVEAGADTVICKTTAATVVRLNSTVKSGSSATIKWTCIPADPTIVDDSKANTTASPTASGTYIYIVTATDAPCTASDTMIVVINDSLSVGASVDSALCGSNTGSITAVLPGGTPASLYDFTWTPNPPGATGPNMVNIAPGNYKLEIALKSNATCKGSTLVNVPDKVVTLQIKDDILPIQCNGDTSDSAWVEVINPDAVGPFSYRWSTDTINDTLSYKKDLVPGTYFVTVTDQATSCKGVSTIVVVEPPALALTFDMTPVKCKGEATGEVKPNVTGGTPFPSGGYGLSWTYHETGQTPTSPPAHLTGLIADSLTLIVTDANGCMDTGHIRVTEPATEVAVSLTMEKTGAIGGNQGKVFADITGGTPNYTADWYRLGNTNLLESHTNIVQYDTLKGLLKNTYHVLVTDSRGCTTRDTIDVPDIECGIRYAVRLDTACFGQSDGNLWIDAIDDSNFVNTSSYTMTLLNPGVAQTITINGDSVVNLNFSGLSPDLTYNVRIQTDLGCDETVGPFNLEKYPEIEAFPISTSPSCKSYTDGEVTVQVTGGTAGFTFDFNDGQGFGTSNVKSGLPSSTWDKNNGDYIYSQVVARKTYSNKQCTETFSYKVDSVFGVELDSLKVDSITCHGSMDGKIDIVLKSDFPSTVNLAYSYYNKLGTNTDTTQSIMEGLDSFTNHTVTVYYTQTAISKRCSTEVVASMVRPDTLMIDSIQLIDPLCDYEDNGSIIVRATGGTGNYVVSLYQGTNPVAIEMKSATPNTFVTMDDNGKGLDSGDYRVVVTDVYGCTAERIDRLVKPDKFLALLNFQDANCLESSNGWVEVSSTQGGTGPVSGYAWSSSKTGLMTTETSARASNLEGAQTYTVTVTDANGCTDTNSVYVDTMYVLRVADVTVVDADCYGGKGTITVNTITPATAPTPYEYNFIDNTEANYKLTNTYSEVADEYTVRVRDAAGCPATTKVTIGQPEIITIIGKVKNADCYQEASGSIKVEATGGHPPYTYEWLNTNPKQFKDSAVDLDSGQYTVRVRDSKNCPMTETFTVLEPEAFTATMSHVKHITCFNSNDGELTVSTEGGIRDFSYKWNHTKDITASISNLKPKKNYRVTVTDANGCEATAQAEIEEPKKLKYEKLEVDPVSCPNYKDGSIDIAVQGGTISDEKQYEYSIDGGATFFSKNKFDVLPSGIYNVNVRDNNGCLATRRVEVLSPEELIVTAKRDRTDSLKLGETDILSYSKQTRSGSLPEINAEVWKPYVGLSCAECESPEATPYVSTVYNLEVNYHKNCIAKSSVLVPVLDPLDFFVPSAFTPGNGDGLNDILYVYGNGIKKLKFMVYNRWGEKVFESKHITKGWNGKYKGATQPIGVYSYVAEVEYLDGTKKNKKGSITLIR